MIIGIDARYGFKKQRQGIDIYNLHEELGKTDGPRYVLCVDEPADPAVMERLSLPSFTVHQIKSNKLFFC